jgi:hypothetical protein
LFRLLFSAVLTLQLAACDFSFDDSAAGASLQAGVRAPRAPTQLRVVTASATQVVLQWKASANAPSDLAYLVLRSDSPTPIARTANITYTDASVRAGITYRYNVRAIDAANHVSPNSNTVVVTTPAGTAVAPAITTQPADVTVADGGSARFSVVATGTAPLVYRWYVGTAMLGNCAAATCDISPAKPANAGNYRVEVSNTAGTAVSRTARLTVTAAETVVNAASCTQADIQAAVNRAADGNVVQIPAGTCSWNDRLSRVLVSGKSLWIRGAGKDKTKIRRGAYISEENTSENDIYYGALIAFDCTRNDMRARFSDMTLEGEGTEGTFVGSDDITFPQLLAFDYGLKLFGCRNFRVHDARFQKFGYSGVTVLSKRMNDDAATTSGVISANEFLGNMKVGLGYGVAVSGNDDWPAPGYGSADNIFIEDNVFYDNRHNVAANYGARYVLRYNKMTTTFRARWWGMVDAHGKSDSNHGTRAFEVYGNTFSMTGIPGDEPSATGALFRGGDGVFFNNTINLGNSPVSGKAYGIFLTVENTNSCSENLPAAYPGNDQTTDLYLWGNSNNNVSLGGDSWLDCAAWFKDGRDFHIKPRPGYTPYTYPHPMRVQAWPTL